MRRSTGYTLAALSAVCAGFSLTLGKTVLGGLPAISFSFWLFAFSVPLTGLLMFVGPGLTPFPRDRRLALLVLGHTAAAYAAIWTIWAGIRRLDPTVAAFLNRTEVLMLVIAGVFLLGERFRRAEAIGAIVAVIGMLLMKLALQDAGARKGELEGFWLLLASSLAFAATEIFAKLTVPRFPATALAFWRSLLLAAAFGLTCFATGHLEVPDPGPAAIILLVALLGPVGARILYLVAIRAVDLSKAAIVTQSQPLFSALLAILLIGEIPGLLAWLGGVLIVAGCAGVVAVRRSRL